MKIRNTLVSLFLLSVFNMCNDDTIFLFLSFGPPKINLYFLRPKFSEYILLSLLSQAKLFRIQHIAVSKDFNVQVITIHVFEKE